MEPESHGDSHGAELVETYVQCTNLPQLVVSSYYYKPYTAYTINRTTRCSGNAHVASSKFASSISCRLHLSTCRGKRATLVSTAVENYLMRLRQTKVTNKSLQAPPLSGHVEMQFVCRGDVESEAVNSQTGAKDKHPASFSYPF